MNEYHTQFLPAFETTYTAKEAVEAMFRALIANPNKRETGIDFQSKLGDGRLATVVARGGGRLIVEISNARTVPPKCGELLSQLISVQKNESYSDGGMLLIYRAPSESDAEVLAQARFAHEHFSDWFHVGVILNTPDGHQADSPSAAESICVDQGGLPRMWRAHTNFLGRPLPQA